MKTYLAEWDEMGVTFCVSFDAVSRRKAENIARSRGWRVVGEFIEEVGCPEDMVAMIEKAVTKPRIH